MLKIGLTGGIGSGKSTVARIFSTFNVPIYFADSETKKIFQKNESVREKMRQFFGNDIFLSSQEINKTKLSEIIFNDKTALQQVNNIVHPAVLEDFENWTKNFETKKYVIIEAAILFESGIYKYVDKIIAVSAPEFLRIERVKLRDNVSEQQVRQRIENQWNENEKIKLSHFVIFNDEKSLVIPQVLEIHKMLEKY